MKLATSTVLVTATLLFATPAFAQYYPSQPAPPPPQYYPPAPSPQTYPPPAPPPVYYQPQEEERKIHFTIRASGGVAFASNGYYCGYYYTYYTTTYSCGAGYSAVWPDINLDVDVWMRPNLGVSIGANVMWGTYTPSVVGVPNNSISSTTWEPHVDFLLGLLGSPQVKGRIRLGFGLYIAEASGLNASGTNITYNGVGGAFRAGIGASFLPHSRVGIGIDAIFEAGWIGSNYVSTVQLLIGPELNF